MQYSRSEHENQSYPTLLGDPPGWQIYVDLTLASDFCFPDSRADLKQDLAEAVERPKDFIVTNSLTPVARQELDPFVQKRRTEKFSKLRASMNCCPGTGKLGLPHWRGDS
jgi:hypothetical protein